MLQPTKKNLLVSAFHRSVRFFIMLSIALTLVACMGTSVSLSVRPIIVRPITTKPLVAKPIIAQENVRIMPLGDSITFGIHSTQQGGYRVTLWNELEADHLYVTFVGSQSSGPASLPDKANEGHPGWRIDQISANSVAWLEKYQPQIILLHIGTNDIIQNHSVGTAPARLESLLVQMTTTLPDTTIIVAQIIPLGNRQLNAEVIPYNNTIPAIVGRLQDQGKHVLSVDMYDAVPLSDLPDRIHPNDQGYALMASVWYKALKASL